MAGPILLQRPARDWLTRIGGSGDTLPPFDAIPDSDLDELANAGFDWLYLLGVWQTGVEGRRISLENPAWQPGYRRALSHFDDRAVCGSPFAVQAYTVHLDFGGNAALAALRDKLRRRGIRLMLDFVPNHMATDHAWTQQRPAWLIQGTEEDLQREPQNYFHSGTRVFAHGRDPYFPGWIDTVQLDYSNAELRTAMSDELARIARQCDGLRCDMAMLILPEIFERTWKRRTSPFWPDAIARVRAENPRFLMMAEVYWGLEWELQQQGFDYAYDKTLYDRVLHENATAVRMHLQADLAFQQRLARFLENHDEPRIAEELPFERHLAAATVTYSIPGLRFFHDGQLEGAVRKPSIHLGWREREAVNPEVRNFYRWLLPLVRTGFDGKWRLLEVRPAWSGNPTAETLLAGAWFCDEMVKTLTVVNFSGQDSQGFIWIEEGWITGETLDLTDQVDGQHYSRSTNELRERGLYIALPPWGSHIFTRH